MDKKRISVLVNYMKIYAAILNRECVPLAEKLLENSYYEPKIRMGDNEDFITISYIYDLSKLIIKVYKDHFVVDSYINGKTEIKDNVKQEHELHVVINIIKMFFIDGDIDNAVLFSGAFNPPTIAHYNMIKSALKRDFDCVIIALSNNEFLTKKMSKATGIDKNMVFNEQQRIEMMLKMTKDIPNVFILGIEEGYTYDVLCQAKDNFGLDKLYFAMGSDKLKEVQKWGNAKKLLSEFSFYVLKRGEDKNAEDLCKDIFANTTYIIDDSDEKYKDISSTIVRQKMLTNNLYAEFMHDDVFLYLKDNFNF